MKEIRVLMSAVSVPYKLESSDSIQISGGTFTGGYSSISASSANKKVSELLAEGYTYKQGDNWVLNTDVSSLTGSVIAQKIPLTISPNPQSKETWYFGPSHTLAMNAAPVDSGVISYVWKNGTDTLDCTTDNYEIPADMPVGNYSYTCEATCDGYTLPHAFAFEIKQSGTQFDGDIKTYNGIEEATSFTVDDTITVKATPTATGQAPTKAAARLRGDPTAGQMVVFVGDTQVSAPADKGADGSYTMTVSAADVLTLGGVEPNQTITLTAKFVGNNNMADAAGTVPVNISAVAKVVNGSYTTYVGNLDDAFKTENDGATITLLKDVTRATTLAIKVNCTLDLNGHNIKSTNETCLSVYGSFAVTIQGEGEIISEQSHALVCIGTVTMEGGTFTGNGENFAGVYANTSSILSVTGENVTIQNTGGGYGLAVNDSTSVQLSAGKYSGAAGGD